MTEVVIIEKVVANGVFSTEVQIATVETPSSPTIAVLEEAEIVVVDGAESSVVIAPEDSLHVLSVGEQGPQGITSAVVGAPTSPSDYGTPGEVRVAMGYLYVCVAVNSWQRCQLATF